MTMTTTLKSLLITGAAGLALTACAATPETGASMNAGAAMTAQDERAQFEADREAILAMAGEYAVTFDFTEFLPIEAGYELKEPKVTPAREVVYVIADEGDYISLQHLLLVGPESEPTVIKHWRQDWAYEPERLMDYRGFNRWEMRDVAAAEAAGAWSQTVYQVDDSPRYAGLARWEHAENASTWEPASSYRPLPRRDATIRDDYDVIDAVNRHTITAWGWTHEQDNSKVVLRDGTPRELVREHGINTYTRTDLVRDDAAEAYWAATEDYWAEVRAAWDEIMLADAFSTEDDAEGTLLYGPVLSQGQAVFFQAKTTEEAFAEAAEIIEARVTAEGEAVEIR
ncbi:MAG: DUF6607 family protein [Oceanicaulis sp.]